MNFHKFQTSNLLQFKNYYKLALVFSDGTLDNKLKYNRQSIITSTSIIRSITITSVVQVEQSVRCLCLFVCRDNNFGTE